MKDSPLQSKSVTQSFCEQHGIKPESFEQSETHGKIYGEEGRTGYIDKAQQKEKLNKALKIMNSPKDSMINQLNIPTQLPIAQDIMNEEFDKALNSKEENMIEDMKKEYNGTQSRWKMIGGKGGEESIQMEDPYEKL